MAIPILTLIHIISAMIWVGGLVILVLFVMPTVKALGPDGGKFMATMAKTNKYPVFMLSIGLLTVISGFSLLDFVSNHFKPQFFSSTKGIILLIGGISGTCAFLAGVLIQRPAVIAAGEIGAQVAQSGGGPTDEQAAEMGKLQKIATAGAHATVTLALIAAITMILGKYL